MSRYHSLYSPLIAVACAIALHACGDSGNVDDEAPVIDAVPAAGAYRIAPTVKLNANEPATIYYTVDGSEPTRESASAIGTATVTGIQFGTPLRFFAVDPFGNVSVEQSAMYTMAAAGPPPVQGLMATPTGADVAVTWTAPGDGLEVMIVRVTAELEQPTDGIAYPTGAASLGGRVLYRGTGTSVTDPSVTPGQAIYVAFAIDTATVYSRGTVASATIPIPAQTFKLRVTTGNATTNPTVTVVNPPTHVGVVAALYAQDAPDRVMLRLTNRTTRPLFSAKLVVGSGTFAGGVYPDSDVTAAGENSASPIDVNGHRGFHLLPVPNAWGPGTERVIMVEFANLTGDDQTLEIDFEIANNPMSVGITSYDDDRFGGGPLLDLTTGDQLGNLAITVSGPGQDFGYRGGVFSPDARYLYLGSRNSPELTTYDLVTMGQTQTFRVTGEKVRSSVHQLVLGPDGRTLYALFNDGGHAYRRSAPENIEVPVHVELVAIDRVTWTEIGRVRLATVSNPDDYSMRGRRLVISPDGGTAAIAVAAYASETTGYEDKGSVHLVKLDTMSEIDTDSAAPGIQPLRFAAVPTLADPSTTVTINPRMVAYANAQTLLVSSVLDETEAPLDAVTLSETTLVEIDTTTFAMRAVEVGGGVRHVLVQGTQLVLGGDFTTNDIYTYDLATHTVTGAGWLTPTGSRAIARVGTRMLVGDDSTATLVDLATGDEVWRTEMSHSIVGDFLVSTPF